MSIGSVTSAAASYNQISPLQAKAPAKSKTSEEAADSSITAAQEHGGNVNIEA